MKPATLRLALLLSVALNLGVIATITLDRLRTPAAAPHPPLHQVLGLNADQRARWEAAERPFLQQFDAATAQLEAHRAALIDALFADTIDSARRCGPRPGTRWWRPWTWSVTRGASTKRA